jgi:hypothetical protein
MLSGAAATAAAVAAAHKKGKRRVSARERNLRRLESNERERMRMHSLNDAFEVLFVFLYLYRRRAEQSMRLSKLYSGIRIATSECCNFKETQLLLVKKRSMGRFSRCQRAFACSWWILSNGDHEVEK